VARASAETYACERRTGPQAVWHGEIGTAQQSKEKKDKKLVDRADLDRVMGEKDQRRATFILPTYDRCIAS